MNRTGSPADRTGPPPAAVKLRDADPGGREHRAGEARSTSSVIVAVGLLAISALSAGQALVIAFLVDGGSGTDAFFAAYAVYVPLATVGIGLRTSLVPLLGGERGAAFSVRAGELIGRAWLVGVSVAALLLILSWPLTAVITDGGGNSGRITALVTLMVLLPAATLQILGGSTSAVLASLRRFRVSIGIYVAAGAIALGTSAALLVTIGIVGAALGVATGALVLAAAHLLYARRFDVRAHARGSWLADRTQATLAWILFAGVALSMSQQLGFAIACAVVSDTAGSVTQYAYAYYVIGVLLNLSTLPLAIVTLPDLVDEIRTATPGAAQRYVLTIGPYVAFLLAPALIAFVAFAEPVLELVFEAGLGAGGVEVMYSTASILAAAMVAISVFTLGSAIVAAQRRWGLAVRVTAASVLIYAVILAALAGEPERVAIGQVIAAACAAGLLLGAIFGRGALRLLGELGWRCLPAVALSTPIVGLRLLAGADPGPAEAVAFTVLGLAAYAALGSVLWPAVARRLLVLLWRPLRNRRREAAPQR